jgi:hypothetical protein
MDRGEIDFIRADASEGRCFMCMSGILLDEYYLYQMQAWFDGACLRYGAIEMKKSWVKIPGVAKT